MAGTTVTEGAKGSGGDRGFSSCSQGKSVACLQCQWEEIYLLLNSEQPDCNTESLCVQLTLQEYFGSANSGSTFSTIAQLAAA